MHHIPFILGFEEVYGKRQLAVSEAKSYNEIENRKQLSCFTSGLYFQNKLK